MTAAERRDEQQQDLGETEKSLPAVANQQQEPEPKGEGSALRDRPFVTLSVAFNGGAVGSLTVPVPFTVRDLEMLRTFSHYLIATFGDDPAPSSQEPSA